MDHPDVGIGFRNPKRAGAKALGGSGWVEIRRGELSREGNVILDRVCKE